MWEKFNSVNTEPDTGQALEAGTMPILSSTGSDEPGQCYNINADTAAAQVAIALKGKKRLVYLSDVPGLTARPKRSKQPALSLAVDEVEPLKQEGVIAQGMLPKVNSAVEALKREELTVCILLMVGLPIAYFLKSSRMKELVLRSYTRNNSRELNPEQSKYLISNYAKSSPVGNCKGRRQFILMGLKRNKIPRLHIRNCSNQYRTWPSTLD